MLYTKFYILKKKLFFKAEVCFMELLTEFRLKLLLNLNVGKRAGLKITGTRPRHGVGQPGETRCAREFNGRYEKMSLKIGQKKRAGVWRNITW